MKRYLPKPILLVAVLLAISVVFTSCQKENFSKYYINGMEAFSAKKYDEAIVYLSRAIELEPYFAQSYYLRAHTHFKMENYEEAIADFTSCVKYEPNHAEAYIWRGEAYYSLEDYSNAISSYSMAIELDMDNAYYYTSRGSSYYLRNQGDDILKSMDDFKRACELGDEFACEDYEKLLKE